MTEIREDMRIFSFGGGVQSMSVMVLAAQGKVHYDAFVFANVGEDSENPATIRYVEEIAKPYAEAHGLQFVELRRKRKLPGKGTGYVETTLMQELERANRTVIIPMRMPGSGKPGNRNCTTDFKIRVIDRWVRDHPDINKESHVRIGLGISMDEYTRMRDTNWHNQENPQPKARKLGFWKGREYPLIDLRLDRAGAMRVILEAGLLVPPKSSCFFCPFTTRDRWVELKETQPELFAKAVEVERLCNSKRTSMNKSDMYLHTALKPLDQAVASMKAFFPGGDAEEEDGCADGGYCMV